MELASTIIAILVIVGLLVGIGFYIWGSRNDSKPSYKVSPKLTKEQKAALKEQKTGEKPPKKEKKNKKSK